MKIRILTLVLGGLIAASSITQASPVYGTAASLTGSRSQNELVLGGNYVGDTVSVSWEIVNLGPSSWSYEYTFTGFASPAISHVILDLTDDAVFPRDPGAVTNASGDPLLYDNFGPSPGNPGFPVGTSIIGVKFDFGGSSPFVITFNSNRAPVWGDIYMKGGNSFAYNPGLADHLSEDTLDFVARPNGLAAVPEPATILSALGGLVLIGFRARSRRNRTL